jgi:hypothetical protein
MRYEVTISKISGLRRPGARPPGPPGSINCLTSHLKYLFDTLDRGEGRGERRLDLSARGKGREKDRTSARLITLKFCVWSRLRGSRLRRLQLDRIEELDLNQTVNLLLKSWLQTGRQRCASILAEGTARSGAR